MVKEPKRNKKIYKLIKEQPSDEKRWESNICMRKFFSISKNK